MRPRYGRYKRIAEAFRRSLRSFPAPEENGRRRPCAVSGIVRKKWMPTSAVREAAKRLADLLLLNGGCEGSVHHRFYLRGIHERNRRSGQNASPAQHPFTAG
jgi:hypothetical protein